MTEDEIKSTLDSIRYAYRSAHRQTAWFAWLMGLTGAGFALSAWLLSVTKHPLPGMVAFGSGLLLGWLWGVRQPKPKA
jgi:hypothetical protein